MRLAVARFAGYDTFFLRDPGACAPGFMLAPASQAKTTNAVQQLKKLNP